VRSGGERYFAAEVTQLKKFKVNMGPNRKAARRMA
jgi:hypothetical protein